MRIACKKAAKKIGQAAGKKVVKQEVEEEKEEENGRRIQKSEHMATLRLHVVGHTSKWRLVAL